MKEDKIMWLDKLSCNNCHNPITAKVMSGYNIDTENDRVELNWNGICPYCRHKFTWTAYCNFTGVKNVKDKGRTTKCIDY